MPYKLKITEYTKDRPDKLYGERSFDKYMDMIGDIPALIIGLKHRQSDYKVAMHDEHDATIETFESPNFNTRNK